MCVVVHECVGVANCKLQTLLRTTRFHTVVGIIQVFKTHILSFIEYRTIAIAQYSVSTLQSLNDILTRVLVRMGITHEEALFNSNFAPLETRRDIAQLGIIHRSVLRQGPPRLHRLFVRVRGLHGHSHQIYDPTAGCRYVYIRNSLFGSIRSYNLLPQDIVNSIDVSMFQSVLQNSVKKAIVQRYPYWRTMLRNFAPALHV